MSPDGRRALTVAGVAETLEVNPQTADLNRDGYVSEREMVTWMRLATAERHSMMAAEEKERDRTNQVVIPPTKRQLLLYALSVGIPFIGFGMMDNAIMILAGEYIDITLGATFGLSLLASAALGNLISDVAGVGFGEVIERLCGNIGLPHHHLTATQHTSREVKWAALLGGVIGVSIGCILGMFPLLFLDAEEDKRLKQIFHDLDESGRYWPSPHFL
jgi:tRNA-specific adenosine deaminase 1